MQKLMGIALIIAALAYAINLLFDAGVFYNVQDIRVQQCRKIEGVYGAEDMVPLQDGGALISSLNRHGNTSGALYYLQPGQAPLQLPGDYPAEFFPHGIDVWQQEGNTWVYVVNHRHQGDRIDVFHFERAAMRLVYQPALSRSVGKNINDISVIDQKRWLVTRDHAYSGLLGRIEDYLRLPLARVLLVDDSGVHTLLDGLHFANGIYYDRKRARLYVAETTSGVVSTWAWQPGGAAPALLSRITGLHGVDNIMPTEKGNGLLVAAHPQLLKLAAYQKNAQARSPSLVWQLAIAPNGEAEQALVIHQSHGQQLAAISVAIPLAGQRVMGSVFDDGLLICEAN
ncbi:TPA: arylesterase [Serratia fonticola]